MEVGEVLNEIKEATGLLQAPLARKLGVSQGTVSKWIAGSQIPNKAQWDEVLKLIRKDYRLEHLLRQIEPPGVVPVMGKIGAGSIIRPDFDQASMDGLYDVTLPFPIPDEMIGLEVDGESMLPKYDPGDVIVVWREQRRATQAYVGQLAAVRTEDGRRYLKTILNGSRANLYRLESFNAKALSDVSISWVGEIHVIVPYTQVRQVGAQKLAATKRKATVRAKNTAGMKELPLGGRK